MGARLTILRTGRVENEQTVLVSDQSGHSWWIDPQAEVHNACGVLVSREGCIISFAQGLRDAGFEVWMQFEFHGQAKRYHLFHGSRHPTVFVYYLVGLAWGLNHWAKMVCAVQSRVSKAHRLHVLEETGKYYLEHSYRAFSSMCLVIPV